MTYRDITNPNDVREELRKPAAAAMALGLPVREFAVRDLTVLHIDGKYFAPHASTEDALRLLFEAQRKSRIEGDFPTVYIDFEPDEITVTIDGEFTTQAVGKYLDDAQAFRTVIVNAFAALVYGPVDA